uniref:Uncharacterized protein n=1 Tax=Aegilops tauschii subsp. strangulata TaxID=200361 RepID=A0A453G3J7_AEGTS
RGADRGGRDGHHSRIGSKSWGICARINDVTTHAGDVCVRSQGYKGRSSFTAFLLPVPASARINKSTAVMVTFRLLTWMLHLGPSSIGHCPCQAMGEHACHGGRRRHKGSSCNCRSACMHVPRLSSTPLAACTATRHRWRCPGQIGSGAAPGFDPPLYLSPWAIWIGRPSGSLPCRAFDQWHLDICFFIFFADTLSVKKK